MKKLLNFTLVQIRYRYTVLRQSVSSEAKETVHAVKILRRLLNNKPVSDKEITFLKNQSLDFTKILALVGVQAIPGSSIAVIALERVAQKNGFSLFPTNQQIPPDGSLPAE